MIIVLLLIQADKYLVKLVTGYRSLREDECNCITAMQGTHLSYCFTLQSLS